MLGGLTVLAGTLLLLLLGGYLVWLRGARPPRAGPTSCMPARCPTVDVLVPVHDEGQWIADKLQNLSELDYPAQRITIWIVDGASSDGTAEAAAAWVRNDARFELFRLGLANKTAQLNAALARSTGEWVLVTDADAQLRPDTLAGLVAAGEADPDLAVVGVPVEPARAHSLERLHWAIANRLRQQESRRGFASIVTAPCYLFRRSLLKNFPEDVVADDVHVALAAAAAGRRVGLVATPVTELRSPAALADFYRHKRRKADAYLREVFRFAPHLGTMRPAARHVFLWRAAHLVAAPVLAGATLIGLGGWLCSAGSLSLTHVLAGTVALAASACLSARYKPILLLLPALGTVLMAALLSALITYPFSRQTACYPKIASRVLPERIKTRS